MMPPQPKAFAHVAAYPSFEIENGPMYFDENRDKVAYQVVVLEDEAPRNAMIRLTMEEFKK